MTQAQGGTGAPAAEQSQEQDASEQDDGLQRSALVGGRASSVLSAMQYLTGGTVLVLMLLTTADVVKRSVVGSSVRGVIEITEVALVITVFLGMVGAEVSGAHIRTSVLIDRLRYRIGGIVSMACLLPCIWVTAWITWETALKAQHSYEFGEYRFGLLSVPIWPARVAIALGMAALTLALVARVIAELRAWRDDRTLVIEEQSLL